MSNFDTIDAITDNLEAVLKSVGLNFSRETQTDISAIPAGAFPAGQIFYLGEVFEDIYGERPEYIEATYSIRVIIREADSRQMMRALQVWAHKIRDVLTVSALNIGALSSSRLVSFVRTERAEVEAPTQDIGAVSVNVVIRYREV